MAITGIGVNNGGDATVFPQDDGTGVPAGEESYDSAAGFGTIARNTGAAYKEGCELSNLDTTNETVDVGPGVVYITESNNNLQSAAQTAYDTNIPENMVYAVIVPTTKTVDLDTDTAADLNLVVDPTQQDTVTIEHNTSPTNPSLVIGNVDSSSAAIANDSNVGPKFQGESVTTDDLNNEIWFGDGRHGGSDAFDDFNKARAEYGTDNMAYRSVPGSYTTTTMDLTQIQGGLDDFALDLTGTLFKCDQSTMAIDATGTNHIDVFGGQLFGVGTPEVAWYLARDSDHDACAEWTWHGHQIRGSWNTTTIYHLSAETHRYHGTFLSNDVDGAYVIVSSDDNHLGIKSVHSSDVGDDSDPDDAMNGIKYFGGTIRHAGNNGASVYLRKGADNAVGKHRFYAPYMPNGGGAHFQLDLASGAINDVAIRDVTGTDQNPAHFIELVNVNQFTTLDNWVISGGTIKTTDYEIDITDSSYDVWLRDWTHEKSVHYPNGNGIRVSTLDGGDFRVARAVPLTITDGGASGADIAVDTKSNLSISGSYGGAEIHYYDEPEKHHEQPVTANDPVKSTFGGPENNGTLKLGTNGAELYVNNNGELVAVDESGNETVIS